MSTKPPVIIEATRESFERDVIEQSKDVPVVVDFWAEWCQPCRLLGPLLEKLANAYDGQFVLVKANTEAMPDIASGFGVQSIPAVFGVRDGQIIDHFVGVVPETALRQWLDRLMPTPAERIIIEARRLEPNNLVAAEARYRAALELNPDEPQAKIGLARTALAQGRVEDAQTILDDLESRGYLEPEAETLKAQLTLKEQGQEAGGLAEARAEAAARPDDLHARFRLAEALAAAGEHVEALDVCLDLVERDRHGVGEEARKTMLAIFQVLPQDSPLVTEYRRRLSLVL